MRTWRVGTISMGASLLILGIALLITNFINVSLSSILTSWWPFIFVVLGAEVLLYIWLQKSGKEMLKYDIFSIIIIGFLGTVGISFMILTQVGITDHIERIVSRELVTRELPQYEEAIGSEVKRIVIENGGNSPLTIEATSSSDLYAFGTYTGEIYTEAEMVDTVDDYLFSTKKGDTIYLTLTKPATESGPFSAYLSMETTILVPDQVKLEVMGDYGQITLKPRATEANWVIMESSEVSLFLDKNSQVDLNATGIQEVSSNLKDIQVDEKEAPNSGYIEKNVSLQLGDATNSIDIFNTQYLTVQQTP